MSTTEELAKFEHAVARHAVLFHQYMGKAMPEAVYQAFTKLRDETIPELRAALAQHEAQHEAQRADHCNECGCTHAPGENTVCPTWDNKQQAQAAEHADAEPLSEFQEGQWWVTELDAWAKTGTHEQKRAVAVVHHMLRSARKAQQSEPKGMPQISYGEKRALIGGYFDHERDREAAMNLLDHFEKCIARASAQATAQLKQQAQSAEPIGYVAPHDLELLAQGYPQLVHMVRGAKHRVPLYTAPPVRELTTEQIKKAITSAIGFDFEYNERQECNGGDFIAVARAVLAAAGGAPVREPMEESEKMVLYRAAAIDRAIELESYLQGIEDAEDFHDIGEAAGGKA